MAATKGKEVSDMSWAGAMARARAFEAQPRTAAYRPTLSPVRAKFGIESDETCFK